MANIEQVEQLCADVEEWNRWRQHHPDTRPDLTQAELTKAELRKADLRHADMRGAILRKAKLVGCDLTGADLTTADLSRATLREATLQRVNLCEANLMHAELRGADLESADLTRASLRGAKLQNAILKGARLTRTDFLGANLSGSNLQQSELCETIFTDTSLKSVAGLETSVHIAPSTIDHRTLDRSGSLPQPFLEACGLPREFVKRLLECHGTSDCSCFISYSNTDETFASKLRKDLEFRGIHCFLACDDMLAGDKILERVYREIGERKRVLLLLSESSIRSEWVEREVKLALNEEELRRQTVLVPVRLDDAVLSADEVWAKMLRVDRQIADIEDWKDAKGYRRFLEKLVTALRSERDW